MNKKQRKRVNELLGNVYGPYPEHIILHHDFPRAGVKPVLHELQLHFNGDKKIIGFDDTEYITKPPANSRLAKKPEIMFFGVLEIESLDWLSEQGLRYLQRDLKDYDQKIHINGHETHATLEDLYEERTPEDHFLKVRICCRKTLLAHYLTSKTHYEKMLIYSEFETIVRSYWVKSLHVACYDASRNFLDRYRLRAAIEDIIQSDTENTPMEARTIDWLIKRYYEVILPRDKERRIVSDPTPNAEKPTASVRQPRHVSPAEIRGYFAAHADWLLAHQLARFGTVKILNIHKWIVFCKQAHEDAIDAARNGVRWGVAHGKEVDMSGEYDLVKSMAQFGQDEEFWRNQLRLVRKSKKKPVEEVVVQITDDTPEPVPNKKRKGINFQYDSDFSDQSSPSDYEEDTEVIPKPPPKNVATLLEICLRPPRIRYGRFVWNCPVPGCQHQVDLLKLSPDEVRSLPADTARLILSKKWRTSDPPVQRALYSMVSDHYEEHCAAAGIQMECLPNRKHAVTVVTKGPTKVKQENVGASHGLKRPPTTT